MNGPRPGRPRLRRLFFALWPDPALRRALAGATADAAAWAAGSRMPPANLHVTLAFLGMVPEDDIPELLAIGQRGHWPRIQLDFDRVEYWRKPKVLVAMPVTIPEAGVRIVDLLWSPLEQLGYEREARPWLPHLTLVRKVSRPPPRGEELPIPPRPARDAGAWKLALVESVTDPAGPRYTPLARWALKGDASHLS
ncbi:MAG TPA: RNA 2',3'-cyclic phosphodiesterase [Steroidobacteraceae bacterium]|nr:RNA 2',3'-cyclic phosphodiesterase [Steroidobacteraceae bacterium]